MKYTIHTGHHRARPAVLGIYLNKNQMHRRVYFHQDCRYHIDGEDMNDTNKLFGLGYLWSHHKHSARFGWRYNPVTGKMVISAYCYDRNQGKKPLIKDLCEVDTDRWYDLILTITGDHYLFEVIHVTNIYAKTVGSTSISFNHKKKWSYRLGLYFGGNQKAPRDMNIEIKKP